MVEPGITHTLRGGKTGWCGSEDGTGRSIPIVTATFQETGRGWWNQSEKAQALGVFRQSTERNLVSAEGYPCVAFDLRNSTESDVTMTLVATFGVRRLTPRECERLQGFPDDWTAVNGMSDSARYRMLGNAVAEPCAEWIGQRIMEVERQREGL